MIKKMLSQKMVVMIILLYMGYIGVGCEDVQLDSTVAYSVSENM